MEYKTEYSESLKLFENNLREIFGSGGFNVLEKSMEYSLFAGGKRLRPIILMKVAEKYGATAEKTLPFAAAIEMIHTYSLIHDDLPCMDDDVLRRGKPTNHTVFGEGNAVLAGDSLLNLAYETMLKSASSMTEINAARCIANASGRNGMCSGQSADLYFEGKKASENDVKYIMANKTGALIRAAFIAGGILGEAEIGDLETLGKIGSSFGLLFQLTDDLLDKFGSEQKLGKSIGKDEKENKQSSIYVFGEEKTKQMVTNSVTVLKKLLKTLKIDTSFFVSMVEETEKRDF